MFSEVTRNQWDHSGKPVFGLHWAKVDSKENPANDIDQQNREHLMQALNK
jgi:hypothetical protein